MLFGGDHEDYLLNDTWMLDLDKKAWKRVDPELSPSPRAGHALVYLPRCNKVALYEGYVQSNSTDYAARPWTPVGPGATLALRCLDRSLGPGRELAVARRKATSSVPARSVTLTATRRSGTPRRPWRPTRATRSTWSLIPSADKRPSATWSLRVDPSRVDAAGRQKLGTPANQRLYRGGPFRAEFCRSGLRPQGHRARPAPRQPVGQVARLAAQSLPRLPGPGLGHIGLGLRPRPDSVCGAAAIASARPAP